MMLLESSMNNEGWQGNGDTVLTRLFQHEDSLQLLPPKMDVGFHSFHLPRDNQDPAGYTAESHGRLHLVHGVVLMEVTGDGSDDHGNPDDIPSHGFCGIRHGV